MATAASNTSDKIIGLTKYAEGLKRRLAGKVPPKHDKSDASRAAFKQMLEIDLKKTETQIEKLK